MHDGAESCGEEPCTYRGEGKGQYHHRGSSRADGQRSRPPPVCHVVDLAVFPVGFLFPSWLPWLLGGSLISNYPIYYLSTKEKWMLPRFSDSKRGFSVFNLPCKNPKKNPVKSHVMAQYRRELECRVGAVALLAAAVVLNLNSSCAAFWGS